MPAKLTHVNVAVIGLGMGRAHLNDYAKHPACTIAALCDADPARLAQAAKDFKLDAARCFTRTEDLFKSAALGKEIRIG